MKYKTIFFDLDGTITDSAPGIMNSIKYALEKNHLPMLSEEQLRSFIGPPLRGQFCKVCGLADEESARMVEDYREYYRDKGIFGNNVYDGVIEMLEKLRKKDPAESYAAQVYEENILLTDLLDILETEKTAAKYMAEKIVRYISEDRPQLLYPCFDRLFALLDSDNAFIRLGVILSVPNLLELDSQTERKWENCAGRYLRLLDTDDIAVFGNVVQSIPRILKAYPEAADTVLPRLLETDSHNFYRKQELSPECRNVAVGHVIDCFSVLLCLPGYQEKMIAFAERNRDNERKQVRGKIARFLKYAKGREKA